jgi:endonuclease YncB( thermonuclease family)
MYFPYGMEQRQNQRNDSDLVGARHAGPCRRWRGPFPEERVMCQFPSIRCVVLFALAAALGADANAGVSAGAAAQQPKQRVVLKGHRKEAFYLAFSPDGKLLASCGEPRVKVWDVQTVNKIAGKATVLDAHTLRFEDGSELELNGGMDAPELEQQALIGGALYAWGKDAAEFLRTLIGDRVVTCYTEGRRGARLHGACFVGETSLEIEMVRNGWAVSHHTALDGWQAIASVNHRGVWRGTFIPPELWRTGDRLPGEISETESQRMALAALQPIGPVITYDATKPGKPVIALAFRPNTPAKVTDGDLARLKSFPNLRSLDVPSTSTITDAALEHLAELTHLVELNVNWTKVTPAGVFKATRRMMRRLEIAGVSFGDEDMAKLESMPFLQVLTLRATRVTDKGLEHLKGLADLRSLSLMSTAVGDAGLKHLAHLTTLQDLDLDRTAITDAGLVHLKGLRDLRRLQLAHTVVTEAGLADLRDLPKLDDLNVRGTRVSREAVDKLMHRLP